MLHELRLLGSCTNSRELVVDARFRFREDSLEVAVVVADNNTNNHNN